MMGDEYLPKIAVADLIEIIRNSDKVLGEIKVGSTIAIILKGNKYIGKRTITFRSEIQEIDYEYAIGLAVKAGQLGACMKWFEENRNFKEGGYIVVEEPQKDNEADI